MVEADRVGESWTVWLDLVVEVVGTRRGRDGAVREDHRRIGAQKTHRAETTSFPIMGVPKALFSWKREGHLFLFKQV